MDKVIITGATSLIGVALCKACLLFGYEVTAVIRPSSSNRSELPCDDKLSICELDITDISQLPQILIGKYTMFFHLAWLGTDFDGRTNWSTQEQNILCCVQAVEAAAKLGCKKFIGTGSQAEYGSYNEALSPKSVTMPTDAYGAAKLASFHFSRIRAQELNIDYNWARVFSVYGPHENKSTLISMLIRQLTVGNIPKLTKCEQFWDYLYVSDAADALIKIATKGKHNSIYCIGSGIARPLRDYVDVICKAIDTKVSPQFGACEYKKNQVMYLQAEINDLVTDTGFSQKVSFEEGIQKTIEWMLLQ